MGLLVELLCLLHTPQPGHEFVLYMFLLSAHIDMFTSGKHSQMDSWADRIAYTYTHAYMCTYRCSCSHTQTLELNAKVFITTINFKDLELRTRALNEPSASGKINLFSWWQLSLAVEAYINGQSYLPQLSKASGAGRAAQLVDCLPSMQKVLGLIPNTWMWYNR